MILGNRFICIDRVKVKISFGKHISIIREYDINNYEKEIFISDESIEDESK